MSHVSTPDFTKLLTDFLSEQEAVGPAAGGSGHLSDISVEITEIHIRENDSGPYQYQVEVEYVKSILTEFTYYPDNPPQEYHYHQTFYFDETPAIIGFSKKVLRYCNYDLDLLSEDEDS